MSNPGERYTLDLPEWSLPYLVNGDSDGLSYEEIVHCDGFAKSYRIVEIADESERDEFNIDPWFGKPGPTRPVLVEEL